MDGIRSPKFWWDTLERSVFTAVETGLASIPFSAALVQEVRWDAVIGAAALAALITAGKCILASRIGRSDTASLVD